MTLGMHEQIELFGEFPMHLCVKSMYRPTHRRYSLENG